VYGAVVAFVLIAGLFGAAYWYALHLPGRSHRGPLPPASPEVRELAAHLRRHVTAIASEPRNVGHHAALEAAAAYIEATLKATGYAVVAQPYEVHDRTVRNIEATIGPAAPSQASASLIIGAHYDSADDAPGANDNGSGVAALLELGRLLRSFAPARPIRLVFFVNEEPPYFQTPDMGSVRYAEWLVERGESVAAMISLETLGSYSDAPGSQSYPRPFDLFFGDRADFVAFVGMPGSRDLLHRAVGAFRKHAAFPSIGGIAPGFIAGIDWSDHWSFARAGIPAIMITDTAVFRYTHYHQPSDTPDKVDDERLARVTQGLERMIRELAQARTE
jgi:Zn-dependent M28 family amino/carboxypeptidase